MKTTISHRDIENLSAFLDGELRQAERSRLSSRLAAEPELAAALEELRQVRLLLRRTPQRKARRSFLLTPRMAGIKPPVPRLVPAFSWASAVATLFFLFTLGSSLVGRLSFGGFAPMAAAPEGYGMGGGPPAAEGLAPTEMPASSDAALPTPTPEMLLMHATQETTASAEERVGGEPQAPKTPALNPWLLIWPGLALLLVGAAVLLRWMNIRTFRRKTSQ